MSDADQTPSEASAPAPNNDSVFVVTHAFGDHAVGSEVDAETAAQAPHHAVVRRAKLPDAPADAADQPQA